MGVPYITTKRAQFQAICGPVNIPWGTAVDEADGVLMLGQNPLCIVTSQNATDFFAKNDDGNGLERGKLISEITSRLAAQDKNHQARWDKIWADSACQKYKREEHEDYWLWNQAFYDAPILELKRIKHLITL